eukprot:c20201_g2_i1 orf=241-759(-)
MQVLRCPVEVNVGRFLFLSKMRRSELGHLQKRNPRHRQSPTWVLYARDPRSFYCAHVMAVIGRSGKKKSSVASKEESTNQPNIYPHRICFFLHSLQHGNDTKHCISFSELPLDAVGHDTFSQQAGSRSRAQATRSRMLSAAPFSHSEQQVAEKAGNKQEWKRGERKEDPFCK